MNIPKITYKDFLKNQKEPERESKKYVDFWLKHIEYCKSGVSVGGVYISGWLYWHLNFFKVAMDERDSYGNPIRVVDNPKLRDNEWYLEFWLKKAQDNSNTPIIAFGTRRFAKTVYITSNVSHNTFIFKHSNPLINGGANADLNNIVKYFSDYYEKRQDCFSDIIKIGDWNKATSSDVRFEFNRQQVTKGKTEINPISYSLFPEIKEKPNDKFFGYSSISVRNLEHGQVSTKEELLAGITPTAVIWDEVGKFRYHKQRSALLPALENDLGEKRLVEFLMGTGGNVDFAVDAEGDFLDTDKSGFLHCDPDEYRATVKEEYFKYYQETDKKVSLFVPAQMSNKGGQKVEIPLSEYLNREFTQEELEALEGLNIWVTNWEESESKIREFITKEHSKSDELGKKAQMYYPFQPEDCFLYSNKNPFPVEDAKKHQQFLKEKGLTGENVELTQGSDGIIVVKSSDLEIVTDYPFKGGAHDAPIVIYERPIFDVPRMIKHGTYVAGFDGTKIEVSAVSDSVNVLYIYKRTYGVNGYQDQIVASFAGRPNQDTKYYRQCMLLLKLYNAECLPENDVNFTKYLKLNNADYLLAAARGTNLRINENSNASTDYGLPATAKNKQHVLKLIKEYCWEEVDLGHKDEEGNPILVRGIYRIPDPMLLEELIKFGNYKNYDRIMAYGHALIWDEELSINNIMGSDQQVNYERAEYRTRSSSLGKNKKYARKNPTKRR